MTTTGRMARNLAMAGQVRLAATYWHLLAVVGGRRVGGAFVPPRNCAARSRGFRLAAREWLSDARHLRCTQDRPTGVARLALIEQVLAGRVHLDGITLDAVHGRIGWAAQ